MTTLRAFLLLFLALPRASGEPDNATCQEQSLLMQLRTGSRLKATETTDQCDDIYSGQTSCKYEKQPDCKGNNGLPNCNGANYKIPSVAQECFFGMEGINYEDAANLPDGPAGQNCTAGGSVTPAIYTTCKFDSISGDPKTLEITVPPNTLITQSCVKSGPLRHCYNLEPKCSATPYTLTISGFNNKAISNFGFLYKCCDPSPTTAAPTTAAPTTAAPTTAAPTTAAPTTAAPTTAAPTTAAPTTAEPTTAAPTTTSTTLPLPFCEPTITREDVTSVGLTHGSLLTTQFGVFGIESISASGSGSTNEARIFDGGLDESSVCTCDNDLLNPNLQYLLVIQEANACSEQASCGAGCGISCCDGDGCTKVTGGTPPNVDDNSGGGTITITFNDSSCVEDFLFVDTEENGGVEAFAENGTSLAKQDFLVTGNNEFNFVSLNVCGVKTIVATLGGSGAISLQCFNSTIDPGTTTTTAAPTTAAPTTAGPTTAAPTTAAARPLQHLPQQRPPLRRLPRQRPPLQRLLRSTYHCSTYHSSAHH
ncbi:unnamed protein product [Effrenium voratum]|uniref:Uncharacterized protein n=1 Tax=Effrenium voratum TaxID=2562239 RepID=A0AA36HQ81_9DINO|nr:unnamed protein product [Effrenium voratum]